MKLYVVQKGDSMSEIARKHGMTIDEFRKMNSELADGKLAQGMKVKVAVGKQPLKRADLATRSEKPKQPLNVQAPQMNAAVQSQPKPAAAPSVKQPNTPVGSSALDVKPPLNIEKTHQAAGGVSAEKNPWNAAKEPAAYAADFSKVFFPKGSPYPMAGGLSDYWDQPVPFPQPSLPEKQGGALSPYAPASATGAPNSYYPVSGNPNPASAVSPAMNPYYPLTAGNPVGPASQAGTPNPYYPVSSGNPNPASVISPAMNPYYPLTAGNPAGPASQAGTLNPYYPVSSGNPNPNPIAAVSPAAPAPQVSPYYSPPQPNAAKPYTPAVQSESTKPVKGAAQQMKHPFLAEGSINVDQPFMPVNISTGKSPAAAAAAPWIKSETMGSTPGSIPAFPKQGAQAQTMPDHVKGGKAGPGAPGSIGGYPYPYMSPMKGMGQPCGCGGPAVQPLPYPPYPPYSPFGPSPAIGYYGGNQPPQPVPYVAPVYQQGQPFPPQKKK